MKLRILSHHMLIALGSGLLLVGCAGGIESGAEGSGNIVDVDHSQVKRQSIGNCWMYADASWLESMNKKATGAEINTSESYWTYFYWLNQIVDEGASEIQTGGTHYDGTGLMTRYGVVLEETFIPEEATLIRSQRQADALAAINTALETGDLKDAESRADRAKVRAALDTAWGLSDSVKEKMTATFGADLSRDLSSPETVTDPDFVKRPSEIPVKYTTGPGTPFAEKTLADAIEDWQYASPWGGFNRAFEKRIQRALNDAQPVVVSWFVDFNAMTPQAEFTLEQLTQLNAPGRQGGHMTVTEDYEIDNVVLADGTTGTLKAGELADDAAKTAALADDAKLKFIRMKNSWGPSGNPLPGHHDVYLTYLRGSDPSKPELRKLERCGTTATGATDPNSCTPTRGLSNVVLPPGY